MLSFCFVSFRFACFDCFVGFVLVVSFRRFGFRFGFCRGKVPNIGLLNSFKPALINDLGSAFDDLDPRLSLLCRVGDDVIMPDTHPKIHSSIHSFNMQ